MSPECSLLDTYHDEIILLHVTPAGLPYDERRKIGACPLGPSESQNQIHREELEQGPAEVGDKKRQGALGKVPRVRCSWAYHNRQGEELSDDFDPKNIPTSTRFFALAGQVD
jgi:hypothetical protein